MPIRLIDPTADRTCRRCGQTKPYTDYTATGHGNGGRRVCIDCIKRHDARRRREAGSPVRHERHNARGEVWCNYCQRYRHAKDFKPHPSRPGKLWTYCRECVLEIDRIRYHAKVSTPEGRAQVMKGRNGRHRRQRRNELRERRGFVTRAVDTISRRGFTLSEISKLTGISLTTFYGWRKDKDPSRAAEARIAIVLQATSHLPIGILPIKGRRNPHPELALVVKRIAPELAKHPMRDSWKYGRRDHQRKAA